MRFVVQDRDIRLIPIFSVVSLFVCVQRVFSFVSQVLWLCSVCIIVARYNGYDRLLRLGASCSVVENMRNGTGGKKEKKTTKTTTITRLLSKSSVRDGVTAQTINLYKESASGKPYDLQSRVNARLFFFNVFLIC